jgi:putative spermidine/putrescine transport system substrate-binding protein
MYLQGPDSTEFSETPTDFATLIPFQYNADTLGYRPDLVGRPIETWGELFNEEFRGKTSILDILKSASWMPRWSPNPSV